MTSVLILRPQPGADVTADRATQMGLTPVVAPLFTLHPLAWDAPDPADFGAVLMTSANAARLAGSNLALYLNLPLFAVGAATAEAAQQVGFTSVTATDTDGAAVTAKAVATGKRHLLHLTGRDHVALTHPLAEIERRIVYAADATETLSATAVAALAAGAVALLHSPRAARLFGMLLNESAISRSKIMIAGLSQAVLDAAGSGWAGCIAAAEPTDKALLAAAAQLCDLSDRRAPISGSDEDRA